jgi:hypothetical protein
MKKGVGSGSAPKCHGSPTLSVSTVPDKVGQVSEYGALVHDGAGDSLRHLHIVRLLVEIPAPGYIVRKTSASLTEKHWPGSGNISISQHIRHNGGPYSPITSSMHSVLSFNKENNASNPICHLRWDGMAKTNVADPWHFRVDPNPARDPRIHASD